MNLPNVISLFRLMCAPLAVWLILEHWFATAFWLFIGAGASDAVDGFIARRFGLRSRLGSYLDPLADKALIVSVYVALGLTDLIPKWLTILVVFRDMLLVGGALFTMIMTMRHPVIRPLLISKANTLAQILLAGTVLATAPGGVDERIVTQWAVFVVGATTLASGAAYMADWAKGPALFEEDNS